MTYSKKKWGLPEYDPEEYKAFRKEYPDLDFISYPDWTLALTNPKQFPGIKIESGIFIGKALSDYNENRHLIEQVLEKLVEPEFKKPQYIMHKLDSKSLEHSQSFLLKYATADSKTISLKLDFLESGGRYAASSIMLQDSNSISHVMKGVSSRAPVARADCKGKDLKLSTAIPLSFESSDGLQKDFPVVFVKFIFKVPLSENKSVIPSI